MENQIVESLSRAELESISGGAFADFADGFCGVVGVATLFSGGSVLANPVGAGAAIGCAAWGVYNMVY